MTGSTLDQLADLVKTQPAPGLEVLMVSVSAISRDEDQPRSSIEAVAELADSVRAIGVQQPLLVRRHPEQDGTYVLVAGERRLLAATEAALDDVPCIVLGEEVDDPGRRLIVQLTENIQRTDLGMMEVAEAIGRLVGDRGLPKKEVAKLLGKPAAFVSKHLALLRAAGPAKEAIDRGRLESPETYRLFAKLPENRQSSLLRRAERVDQPIGRSEVEKALQPPPDDPPADPLSATPERYSLRLTPNQIERLIQALGGQAPSDPGELKATLLSLL